MGFAEKVRDLLSGGSGKHQKPVHGARDQQAPSTESGQGANTDQAAWHAETPDHGHDGQASTDEGTGDATDTLPGLGGQDQGSSSASSGAWGRTSAAARAIPDRV